MYREAEWRLGILTADQAVGEEPNDGTLSRPRPQQVAAGKPQREDEAEAARRRVRRRGVASGASGETDRPWRFDGSRWKITGENDKT
jgi:hypothetical protein